VYIIDKTPALPFTGIKGVSHRSVPHAPPMLSDGGVPPPQGYAAYREICRITFNMPSHGFLKLISDEPFEPPSPRHLHRTQVQVRTQRNP
ncbi:MAG: hypothetical protein ACOYZ6_13575, partial [Chloroflexota bacterium]